MTAPKNPTLDVRVCRLVGAPENLLDVVPVSAGITSWVGPDISIVGWGDALDEQFVGNATVEYDKEKAYEGAHFIYAKNWAAYKDPNYGKILSTDRSWTVDSRKMALTDNAYFMHCLPVRRNMIVSDEVIESPQSIVIPEAANRVVSMQVVLKRMLQSIAEEEDF